LIDIRFFFAKVLSATFVNPVNAIEAKGPNIKTKIIDNEFL